MQRWNDNSIVLIKLSTLIESKKVFSLYKVLRKLKQQINNYQSLNWDRLKVSEKITNVF